LSGWLSGMAGSAFRGDWSSAWGIPPRRDCLPVVAVLRCGGRAVVETARRAVSAVVLPSAARATGRVAAAAAPTSGDGLASALAASAHAPAESGHDALRAGLAAEGAVQRVVAYGASPQDLEHTPATLALVFIERHGVSPVSSITAPRLPLSNAQGRVLLFSLSPWVRFTHISGSERSAPYSPRSGRQHFATSGSWWIPALANGKSSEGAAELPRRRGLLSPLQG
jgi:hypothetical protein